MLIGVACETRLRLGVNQRFHIQLILVQVSDVDYGFCWVCIVGLRLSRTNPAYITTHRILQHAQHQRIRDEFQIDPSLFEHSVPRELCHVD